MRRIPILLVLLLVLALLAVVPVSAEPAGGGTEVVIAVPAYVRVDTEIDLVMFTGRPGTTVDVPFYCFYDAGQYPAGRMVILDKTFGQAGAVTDVISNLEFKAGTRMEGMTFRGYCDINQAPYVVYQGVTQ
jgi:hypothetical protein